MNSKNFPSDWVWTDVGTISNLIHYGYTASATDDDTGVKLLRITDIQNNSVGWDDVPYCEITEPVVLKYLLKEGDIVFARTGATVGKSFLIGKNLPKSVFASYLIRIILNSNIEKRFVYHYFQSSRYWEQIRKNQLGIGQPNVNSSLLSKITIPIPPQSEQHRIVTKIEELLTQLDAGVASLKKAQAQLKRYRQAVLKAAFEGRLTQEWRDEHKGKVEPADVLLNRVKKSQINQKIKNLHHFNTDRLPQLPDGWKWIRLDDIANVDGGITKNEGIKVENGRSVPYLSAYNVQRGFFNLSKIKNIDAPEPIIVNLRLVRGDILFTAGGDRDKLGRGWVWNEEIQECIFQNHIFRARLLLEEMNPKYISWYANAQAEKYFMKEGKQTTNIASINLTQLRALPIVLAPLKEQQQIISEIERHFSQIDHLESTITTSLRQAETLRQSILKRAFEGKLVPQDPNDDPASILLERIKAEKARHTETKKGKTLQPKSLKRKNKNAN